MPIYEYRCQSCGDQLEVMQKITDRPLRKCKKCSGRLEKLISRTAFQLKGGGWYASGYSSSGSSGGGSSRSSKSEGSAQDSSSTGSGKSDKKSDPAGAAAASA